MSPVSILPTLEELRARIIRYRGSRKLNEENTKATLIEPVLRALGWNLEEFDEVQREFKIQRRDKPVDYALLLVRTPRLLIEAKALGENLDDRRWASQIMGYAVVAGAEWVMLTDGDAYRIFNAHAAVTVDEKLFRSVRITDEATRPEDTLELLSKERMAENRLQVLWKAFFVDRKVKSALGEVFSPAPDAGLVRLIQKRTQSLTPEEIRRSLARVVAQFEFPVEPSAGKARSEQASSARKGEGRRPAPRREAVSPADLISAGLISAPLALTRTYRGKEVSAHIEPDGTVTCLGKSYSSLSTAAGMARASVIGIPAGRKYPQTNGWTFWLYRDAGGDFKEIDHLRQSLLRQSKLRKVGDA